MAKVSSRVSDRFIGINLSLNQLLSRARSEVQRGQIDAALRLYKGLLVTFPNHPQINTEVGVLLLHHRPAQEAVKPLEKAVAAMPMARELSVCLLVAYQRCGNLKRAKEVLAQMQAKGFDPASLAQFEQELNEPPREDLDALDQMIAQQQWANAEIAARMMVIDYPDSATAKACLQRVLAQGETHD
jgi:pentatricopeptide repeat protein